MMDGQDVVQSAVIQKVDWYKDALIYQLHVKSFQDSNDDGIGDFAGLMSRLDHIQELGATAVWLLPFYPSPLRDDGYDIAEFKAVNPQYGTLEDFQAFVDEAHRRGLKVITELVINHTSDQHEWFQRARHAPKGSPERDYYVWSDDDAKWMDKTRVIFNDTHSSNWSWDPVAEQFYWHRFFSHQPDLNFDNPDVLAEVLDVMHFWLDMGVDGLRLDAIPYLVERDGTNNENLPETHDVLKAIRADLDRHYEGRMLLAEANQWPEDTRPYFGEGDECHMGFHFPLMPRMFMAVAQEDRHAITDIIRQTPEIPEDCQWAIFLRNHDELTLEMVTDRERDYLWDTYAADKRSRINMGIRRRLAPLLENDRRKIELMNAMLLAMPGTPVIYYGDEIGMGDNYYLGDRDGVRTPMQWSSDRNAGFSRAQPQQLFLPTIQDPVYGFQAVNVEAQRPAPASPLNWMRRMIAVRKRHPVFGRGEISLLYPGNRKVLAFTRSDGDETVLFVGNMSRQAQAAEISLPAFRGRVPVEMIGANAFPPIGDQPYMLTLPAYGFYWFVLEDESHTPSWHVPAAQMLPDFLTLTTRDGRVDTALDDRGAVGFVSGSLADYLALQRWYAGTDGDKSGNDKSGNRKGTVALDRIGDLDDGHHGLCIAELADDHGTERYFLPLSIDWETGSPLSATLARVRRTNRVGALVDSAVNESFARAMLDAIKGETILDGPAGRVVFTSSARLGEIEDDPTPRLLSGEQSNSSIAFADRLILKLYRRLRTGLQPEVEITRFLTEETDFDAVPALLGTVDLIGSDGEITTLATLSRYVPNQGDAWTYVLDMLERAVERQDMTADDAPMDSIVSPIDVGEVLGRRVGQMHLALASGSPGSPFAQDPMTPQAVTDLVDTTRAEVSRSLDLLQTRISTLDDTTADLARTLLDRRDALMDRLAASADMTPSGGQCRIHGDLHLGQVLIVQNDMAIIDFEGEPTRSLAERTAKTSPLRDVAGLIRSFDYALHTILRRRVDLGHETDDVTVWRASTQDAFLNAYRSALAGSALHPSDSAFESALLDLFVIQKAAYEIDYELAMRPTWTEIPIRGLLDVLNA